MAYVLVAFWPPNVRGLTYVYVGVRCSVARKLSVHWKEVTSCVVSKSTELAT